MSNVNIPFLIIQAILVISLLCLRRERKIIPIIVGMCFMPADITIQLGTLDFKTTRILALVGFISVLFSNDNYKLQWNVIDRLFLAYQALGCLTYIVASVNIPGAIIYKGGVFIDGVILYFVFRSLVRDHNDVRLVFKCFAVCIIILLPFALFEFFAAKNLFSFIGREQIKMRHGEIRAAGSFSHAILFGTFAVALFPAFWAHYRAYKTRVWLFAALCTLFFVYVSSSSGPIVCLAIALVMIFFFKWRQKSRQLAWAGLFGVLFIHFAREKSFWHFIYVRISVKGSSTGYHRYLLTKAAAGEFWDWWLLGYGDVGPAWHLKYWPWTHARFTDVTNHYLLEGIRGGLFTMLLFIVLCYKSIKALGSYTLEQDEYSNQWVWWGVTIMLITQCVAFLSVSYFGQITMLLYLNLAIAALAFNLRNQKH